MAVVRDGTPATGSVNGADSFTITLSTTGPNRVILVGIGNSNSNVTNVVPTASGLTFVQVDSTQTAQGGTAQLYRAFAPTQLTSVVITCNATPTSFTPQLTGWAVGYSGADTSGTNGSGAIEASGGTSNVGSNGLSQAVTTLTDNALVVAFAEHNNTTVITAGASQTKIFQLNNAGGFNAVALLERTAATSPPASVTMSYTLGGSFIPDALIVAAIKPAPAVAAVSAPLRIANANVGPMVMRRNFRQPFYPTRVNPSSTQYSSNLAADLTFSGNLNGRTNRLLTAGLSFVGTLNKKVFRTLSATLSFVGVFSKRVSRGLSAALSFLVGTGASGSNPLFVQKNLGGSGATSTSSTAVAFLSNTTTGNTIVVGVGYFDDAHAGPSLISSITDSQGNTYVKAIAATHNANEGAEIWYAENITGGTTPTVTVNFSSTCRPGVYIYEYSGLATSSSLDVTLDSVQAGSSYSVGPTATTAQANEIAFAIAAANANGSPFSVGAGYADFQTRLDQGYSGAEDQVLSSVGAQTAPMTLGGVGTRGGVMAIATFKGTAASPLGFFKQTRKALSGVLSFAGNLATSLTTGAHNFTQNLTAALSFSGNLNKTTSKPLSGALSFVGALTKQTRRSLSGILSFSGAFVATTIRFISLTAGLSFSGALVRRTNKSLTAGLSFVGSIAKAIRHGLSATLSFVGSLTKRTARSLAGGLSFVGTFVASTVRLIALTAALSFTGAFSKRTNKSLNGGLSFTGAMAKFINHGLTATLSFTGAFSKRTFRALVGGLSFTGSLLKRVNKTLAAGLSFVGVIAKRISRTLTAGLSFTGTFAKTFRRIFSGVLSFSGAFAAVQSASLKFVNFVAGLSFSGSLNKRTSRRFTATLSFVGTFVRYMAAVYVNIVTRVRSGGKTTIVQSSQRTTEVSSGATIENVSSSGKDQTVSGGDVDTTVTGSNTQGKL